MRKFILYNNDVPVARFTEAYTLITEYRPDVPELLPMQIRAASADGFAGWLRERSIDLNTLQHRNMVRDLWGSRDKVALALLTHMFSISDTFTCFEEGSFTPRLEICAPDEQGYVSRYILVSSDTSLRDRRVATPNVSTDGSFPKTWVFEGGAWWLYKIQSPAAVQTEIAISRVLEACGWDAARYEPVPGAPTQIRSLNFVGEGEFFEPYESFRHCFENPGDDDDVIYANIASLGGEFELAWRRIGLADAFFLNTDRHMRNFGVMRSASTGRVIRLAPNFDNNQAYIANPGGRYSTRMLAHFLRNADRRTADDLKRLMQNTRAEAFLRPVCDEVARTLGVEGL